jgi:hypothetical protein
VHHTHLCQQASHESTHGRAAHHVDGDLVLFQGAQHTDVCVAASAATAEHEPEGAAHQIARQAVKV